MFQNEFGRKAFAMFTRDEGAQRNPYDDATGTRIKAPKGNVTIGVGRNLDAKPLSNAIMFSLLEEDLEQAIDIARDVVGAGVWNNLTDNRKLALVNLAFSLGSAGLRTFKKMLLAVQKSDWAAAGAELRTSLWAHQVDKPQVPNQGRDDRVVHLLEDDHYDYQS